MSKHTVPQNLITFSGDTSVFKFTVTNDAGEAVDLAGASATWKLAKRVDSPVLLTKTVGPGIVVTDIPGGLLEATLIPADTEDLRGLHYWELQITDSAGQKVTAAQGHISIYPELITD